MYEIDIEGEISLLENGDLKITSTVLTLEEAKKRVADLNKRGGLRLSELFTFLEPCELDFDSTYDYIDAFAMGIPIYDENENLNGYSTLFYYEFMEEGEYIKLLSEGELTLPLLFKE